MTVVVPKREDPKPATGAIVRNGLIATAVAVAINVLLYLIGRTFTFPDDAVSPLGMPVTIYSVVALSIFGGIMAIGGYIFLLRRYELSKARRLLWMLAVVILVLFAFSPLAIENISTSQLVIMEIMHVVAGVLPIYAIARA